MDYALLVHLFDTLDHLDGDEQHGLQVEAALARLEEVLEGGAQQVHHHHVELLVSN